MFANIHPCRLPDAAIDLVDEACTAVKIGTNSSWEQLGRLKRQEAVIKLDINSLEVSHIRYTVGSTHASFPTRLTHVDPYWHFDITRPAHVEGE